MSEIHGLRALETFRGFYFFVPSYQRGYRWADQEVGDLLQDIKDFKDNPKGAKFYCLQPVVVQKEGDRFRVIDGQQRLTTIFLIIQFLEGRSHFKIAYQTRPQSAEFLENIAHENPDQKDNIDFYHFVKAYQTIQKFFKEKEQDKQAFLKTLLDKCVVLWYETQDDENEVFRRLNSGKIPLMETEIIKALFLSKDLGEDVNTLIERSQAWYHCEKTTRAEQDFIYCVLSPVHEKDILKDGFLRDDIQRIEIYLKAIVKPTGKDRYLLEHFYHIYQEKGQEGIEEEWDRLKDAIATLSGFASKNKPDREIFHHLGFLTLEGADIYAIYKTWLEDSYNDRFAAFLFAEAKKRARACLQKKKGEMREIEDLQYSSDKRKLQTLLVLFNLAYLIDQQMAECFRFNRFVLERWSLEHIYAQNSQSIAKNIAQEQKDEVVAWLKEVKEHIEDDSELKKEIQGTLEQLKNTSLKNLDLEVLFKRIDQNFEDDENLHRISNLTLLDRRANSQIGNLIFSHKRAEIQELQKQDRLIPITTQRVFNKEFSKEKDNPNVFTRADQKDYLEEIKKYLHKYLEV
ncbi:DUF262 domain-containing protein [Helicobacter mehlei]|uniref:DUF262 domain-containing protein n=1 Tax=Helicobacter mehlei TaxID=2316080 RepID=A0A553V2L3_9HELI|nr:DUF262 domain-containing protein [Helicobacter mehlei]TSA86670.1 DUF262 domain-containing protein [Helicobacter mehlei]